MRDTRFLILKTCSDTYFSEEEPKQAGDAARCPECGEYISLIEWLPPYHADLEVWGGVYGDVAFGPGNELLISERFLRVYREHNLTGFREIEPVRIRRVQFREGRAKGEIPRYFCVKLSRSRAVVDDEASRVIRKAPVECSECLSAAINRIERVRFVSGSWSEEDIFYARGLSGRIVVTERFSDLVRRHDLKNFVFVEAEDFFDEDISYRASIDRAEAEEQDRNG